jgi:hypothetical protein
MVTLKFTKHALRISVNELFDKSGRLIRLEYSIKYMWRG